MDGFIKDKLTMIAALGASAVVGFSGIYLFYKSNKALMKELGHLNNSIEQLKFQIEELKLSSIPPSPVPDTMRSFDAMNVSSLFPEDEDDAYYDFSDDESASPFVSLRTAAEEQPTPVTVPPLFSDIDLKLDGTSSQKLEAYEQLQKQKNAEVDNPDFLWRLAKATHLKGIISNNRGDKEEKKQLAFEAFEAAKQALTLETNNPEVHKWYAITIGSLTDYISLSEKIKNGGVFKNHVEEALRLKPEDPSLHHLLGRWCYEIALLSWIERKVASLPSVSFTEARSHLLKAEKLRPGWRENMLFISKCFIGESNYSEANVWIKTALEQNSDNIDDILIVKELRELQNTYK